MPEATISHDTDRFVRQCVTHAGRAGERQAISHYGVAQVKGGRRGEGMTSDVRGNVKRPEFLLQLLDSGK